MALPCAPDARRSCLFASSLHVLWPSRLSRWLEMTCLRVVEEYSRGAEEPCWRNQEGWKRRRRQQSADTNVILSV